MSFPLAFRGRIALLDCDLQADAYVRRFASADLRALREYAPEALVAPLDVALTFADQKLRGLLDLPSLSMAIVVLTGVDDSPLAEHHRDLLWHAFGLPVFEQLCAKDGRVIARECEVHDGLHITAEDAAEAGLAFTNAHCECGSEVPRLLARERVCADSSV